jgi:DNA-directed RNA polymerase beta subunit
MFLFQFCKYKEVKAMANLKFTDKVNEASEKLSSMEQMFGKNLLQPFTNTNAGARKIMHGTHRDHVFPLMHGEKAIVETGYENRFGDYSSSITAADSDYRVIAKISKFSFSPNHHYYLIIQDMVNNKLDVVERISYHHITEGYGYLYNNEYLDSLQPGSMIPNGAVVQKSLAFDEYNNRKDGVNFNVAYMALDDNMEDSVLFSDVAASKLTAPLIKPVTITINENDIPLNLYGNDKMYKSIPDIGEEINDAILIGLRKEKKDEALFMQSTQRLKELMLSDEKYTLHGRVIDINIYCNNPENLDGLYYAQFKMYYNELQRMSAEIVTTITPYAAQGYEMTYELQKLFANAKRVCNKDQYMEKRLFSFLIVEVVVLEEKELEIGDKTSNRFGGKGVISRIIPQKFMPTFGDGEYVDVIMNSSTMYNRENPGQLFELSLTHIGCEIIKYIKKSNVNPNEAIELILKYATLVSAELGNAMRDYLMNLSEENRILYLENLMRDGCIHLSIKPATESMDIDRLADIYKQFPFIEQTEIKVPMVGSDGKVRYVPTRRRIVVGKQYMFRLKQFAEEKFSATNLSATNIRNENTKSKANREYKELHSNTPIRFGNMESNDLNHIGSEHVVANMLVHSLSPHGRRLTEQMYTGEPFKVDIKLDSDSKNRMAEIAITYLKTIGKRLKFLKVKKKIQPAIVECPVTMYKPPVEEPIFFNAEPGFDFEKDFQERQRIAEKRLRNKKKVEPAIYYEPRSYDTMNKLKEGEDL